MNPETLVKRMKVHTADDAAEWAREEFRVLQRSIFKAAPEGCFLREWKALDLGMIFTLSPEMVDRGLVNPKDICALCSIDLCPSNKVSFKFLRALKIKILGLLFNR